MLKQLLSQSSYWVINKNITYEIGLEASLLLTHLIDCAEQFNQPFYQQKERIMKYTGLGERAWRKSIKILKDKNILSIEKKGNPAKNFYTLDEDEIYKLLNSASTSDAQSAFTRHARNALTSDAQSATTKKVIKENNKKNNNNTSNTSNASAKIKTINADYSWKQQDYLRYLRNGYLITYGDIVISSEEDVEEAFKEINIFDLNI